MILIYCILIIAGVYISAYVCYSLFLIVANIVIKDKEGSSSLPATMFAIVIPAHDEELLLSRLLESINRQNYPSKLIKTIVVADNCVDNTAKIGSENGATVLERRNEQLRGKGYAIKFALEQIDLDGYGALLVVDADSIISNDLLLELDKILAKGMKVIQCYNGVANPEQSWFTRLLDVSRTIGNEMLHPAKEKLGLSSYLMGNGMCFSITIINKYGWDAFSVGEDWEYYAKLVQAGEVIAFANKARVYHQESSSLKQATSQRMRWSSGRFAIAWKYGITLFSRGLLEGDIKKIDASLPLLFPNPSLGINIAAIGFIISMYFAVVENQSAMAIWLLFLMLLQLAIFLLGVLHTRDRFKNFVSLFAAPIFLAWKMGVDIFSAFGMGRKKWIRTERKL